MKQTTAWVFIALVISFFAWTGCQGEETNVSSPLPVNVQEDRVLLYLDPAAPPNERIEDLLARMTLAEKIGQMTLVEKGSIDGTQVTAKAIGGVLSGGGGGRNIIACVRCRYEQGFVLTARHVNAAIN